MKHPAISSKGSLLPPCLRRAHFSDLTALGINNPGPMGDVSYKELQCSDCSLWELWLTPSSAPGLILAPLSGGGNENMIRDPVGRAQGPPVLTGGLRQHLAAPASLEIHSQRGSIELGLPDWPGYSVPALRKPAIWRWELGKRDYFEVDYWPSKEFLSFLHGMWNSGMSKAVGRPCFH